MRSFLTIIGIMFLLIVITLLCGCQDDAFVANVNMTKAADNFEIARRIVFLNGITDSYLLVIEGYCSINHVGRQLEVICKVGPGTYKKHFLGLSDNVTYFAEQLDPAHVSVNHYRITFKPSTIIPHIDVR